MYWGSLRAVKKKLVIILGLGAFIIGAFRKLKK